MKQRETVAYGHPEFGGIVFGGERPNQDFSLEQWDFAEEDESYKVTAEFYIYGDDKADFVSKLRALEAAVRNSGNIAITTGVAVTRTVDVTVAAQLVTITRTAGAVFTTFDLGMPIDLVGVGTVQVTNFVSGSVVEALIPAGLTPPGAAAGLTATIGHTHFAAVDDPDKDIYLARADIDRAPDGDDDDLRRRFIFSATFGKPASKARAAEFGNRQKGFYSVTTGGDGLKRVIFRGVYTAGRRRRRDRRLFSRDDRLRGLGCDGHGRARRDDRPVRDRRSRHLRSRRRKRSSHVLRSSKTDQFPRDGRRR